MVQYLWSKSQHLVIALICSSFITEPTKGLNKIKNNLFPAKTWLLY